jgi:hypothetical protein
MEFRYGEAQRHRRPSSIAATLAGSRRGSKSRRDIASRALAVASRAAPAHLAGDASEGARDPMNKIR